MGRVTRNVPFGKNEDVAVSRILSGNYNQELLRNCSGSLRDLLSKMFRVDERERLSVQQVLEHPWMNGDLNPPQPLLRTPTTELLTIREDTNDRIQASRIARSVLVICR